MKKISISSAILSGGLIATTITAGLTVTSCGGIHTSIPEDVNITTTEGELNTELGAATFGVMLPEQPKNDKALISISKLPNYPDVRLVQPWDNLGIGVSSAEYDVKETFFTFSVGFKDFFGVDTSSAFNITIEYTSQSNDPRVRELKGLQVFAEYKNRPTGDQELHILDINDFHGAAPGYGDDVISGVSRHNPGMIRLAESMGETIEKYPGSVVLSAGDNATGDAFSTAMHGKSLFPVEKSLGVAYSAVGNHEFDWGNDQLAGETYDKWGRTDRTNGKYYVAGNILSMPLYDDYKWVTDPSDPQFETDYNIWNNSRIKWADPYKLINMDGHLVCLFGLTTKATLSDGNQDVVNHYSFIDYNAAVSYSAYFCKKELGPDWFNKIDCFLLLTHLECDQKINKDKTRGEVTGPAADLAKEIDVNWVDGIIAGHSHKDVMGTVTNHFGKKVWIGQGKNSGQQYVDTKLIFDNSKPVGNRLKEISMETKTIKIAGSEEEREDLARQELLGIRANPSNDTTRAVIAEYDAQRNEVADVLDHKIAETKFGCRYQVYHEEGTAIGHKYFRPYYSDQSGNRVYTYEDELGAWINLAQLIGFSSKFQEEIEGITSNLKNPSISFINFDSLGGDIPAPVDQATRPVTLKDLFTIQAFENSVTLGYLSVWQLANIINYLLCGKEDQAVFHYDMNNEYFDTGVCERNNLEIIDRHDAELAGPVSGPIRCVDEYPEVEYKEQTRKCCYLSGPIQWYGFRFEVVPCDPVEDINDIGIGREYKLKYVSTAGTSLANKYTHIPQIWIYRAPETFDPLGLYTPNDPEKWIPASAWLEQEAYIPCVINSFLYDGGNAQCTMFKQYFDYNAAQFPKLYNIHHKVDITRDLLVEFCELTSGKLSKIAFDLQKNTYQHLVTYSQA